MLNQTLGFDIIYVFLIFKFMFPGAFLIYYDYTLFSHNDVSVYLMPITDIDDNN